jgi:hypothetical protein
MLRFAAPTLVLALLASALVTAQAGGDKKKGPPRPEGTYTRTEGDVKVTFEFKKRHLQCTLTEGTKKLTAHADFGVSKDGVLFGRISKIEKAGFDEGPKEGTLFSFRFVLKEGGMTVRDLEAPGNGNAKQIIEGDYKGGSAKKNDKAAEAGK